MSKQSVESYQTGLARMRDFEIGDWAGDVREEDFAPPDRLPYRYGTLEVHVPHADAPGVASRMTELAIEIDGYLAINVHDHYCRVVVSISHFLDEVAS